MYIANIRVTHNTAPHDVLDRLVFDEIQMKGFYEEFLRLDNIDEALLLQTCNRFEVYFSGKDEGKGKIQARKFILNYFDASLGKYIILDSYLDTLDHLFKVVSSVDSMIVGENQILAQVREALDYASINRYSGRVLEPIFQKTLFVGKRIRRETNISKGKVSIASAAVDLANQHNSLKNNNVMIIGTGKMASLLAEYLSKFEPRELVVVGRTPERLDSFCQLYSGRPVSIAGLPGELENVDILFSATSCPRVLVTRDAVDQALTDRENRMIMVDIAMPADIDPSVVEISKVEYFSIDDLKAISTNNMAARQEEINKAKIIIKEELDRMKFKLENLHSERFLSNLNLFAEEIRQKEMEKALRKLDSNDAKTCEVINDLTRSLTRKILHNFMTEIKSNPATAREMDRFLEIFMGNGHVPGHPNEKAEK